jgi:hypothetical protein
VVEKLLAAKANVNSKDVCDFVATAPVIGQSQPHQDMVLNKFEYFPMPYNRKKGYANRSVRMCIWRLVLVANQLYQCVAHDLC